MRHQPRLLGDQAPQILIHRRRIERGQAQPRQFRHLCQQPPRQLAQTWPARQIGTVGGDVHAGQHHFLKPARDQGAHLCHHRADGHRAVGAAAERDDTKGAAVIAALLDLHEGAGAARELRHQMRRRFPRGHDVADQGARAVQPAFGPEFFGVAQYAMHAGQGGPGGGIDLRRATRDHDAGAGVFPRHAADGLAGLALGLGGDGAGVDDHRVG